MSPPAGHRLAPHTADCIIEAWGPNRAACLTEALLALVEGFAEIGDARPTQVVPIGAVPGPAEDELVELLEQVIFDVDVLSVVPVRFHLGETEEGVIAGDMGVVPAERHGRGRAGTERGVIPRAVDGGREKEGGGAGSWSTCEDLRTPSGRTGPWSRPARSRRWRSRRQDRTVGGSIRSAPCGCRAWCSDRRH